MDVVINYVDLSSGEQEYSLGSLKVSDDKAKLLECVIKLAGTNSLSALQAAESHINLLTSKLANRRAKKGIYDTLVAIYHILSPGDEKDKIYEQLNPFKGNAVQQIICDITKFEVQLDDYKDMVIDISSKEFKYFIVGEKAGKIHVVHKRHSMVDSAFDVLLKRVGHTELDTYS